MFDPFAYRAITFLGRPFQAVLLKSNKISFCRRFEPPTVESHNTSATTPRSLTLLRFRLIRLRSPLLTESIVFLFLGLLRCFNSPRMAVLTYEFSQESSCDHDEVAPFGNLRIKACLQLPEAYRSLPRPSSPIGTKLSTNGS